MDTLLLTGCFIICFSANICIKLSRTVPAYPYLDQPWMIAMPPDEKIVTARLLTLKSELQQLIALSADDRSTVKLDQSSVGRLSRMDAMQRQAMANAQQRERQNQLIRIDQALQLLKQGEYGYCLSCGEEIPPRRLEVDPTATHCVACKGG